MPRFRYAAVVAIGALLITACASVPSRPINDLKIVAGHWQGNGGTRIAAGYPSSGPVELTIREDGSGEFFLPQLAGGTRVPVRLTISNGKMVYETATSKGTATLHEGDGKRILQGESVLKNGSGTGWMELTPAK